jgi:hypothetical protein
MQIRRTDRELASEHGTPIYNNNDVPLLGGTSRVISAEKKLADQDQVATKTICKLSIRTIRRSAINRNYSP